MMRAWLSFTLVVAGAGCATREPAPDPAAGVGIPAAQERAQAEVASEEWQLFGCDEPDTLVLCSRVAYALFEDLRGLAGEGAPARRDPRRSSSERPARQRTLSAA